MAEDSNVLNVFDVEILQKNNSLLSDLEVLAIADKWIRSLPDDQANDIISQFNDATMSEHISGISIQRRVVENSKDNFRKFNSYVYQFNSAGPEVHEGEDEQQISIQWILPTEDFHGLWESLLYDDNIKNDVKRPPGTGKTSLCKALAQKVAIRFKSWFRYGFFVEVNTHSLFSKWFSESGKLVTKMFQEILTLLEDPQALVIVLLDEVESLARSRASALTGNEPSDALRVVNALLTHLDTIKRHPNVLILTTSNITEAIDVALIDRADIKQFIGLPSSEAIFQIYSTCIKELIRTEVIINGLSPYDQLNWCKKPSSSQLKDVLTIARLKKLRDVSEKSKGLSGRSLRKLPFVAYALYVKDSTTTLDDFINALEKAVDKHWNDVKNFKVHV